MIAQINPIATVFYFSNSLPNENSFLAHHRPKVPLHCHHTLNNAKRRRAIIPTTPRLPVILLKPNHCEFQTDLDTNGNAYSEKNKYVRQFLIIKRFKLLQTDIEKHLRELHTVNQTYSVFLCLPNTFLREGSRR